MFHIIRILYIFTTLHFPQMHKYLESNDHKKIIDNIHSNE